eukprot:TRINITY_DN18523_c0_g2_i2.p1 TRINITY_DN18523_c0_g2~~TRINITY_DN18523_c0_g2_i2.p1  ORF type:complete len:154 (+),score=35.45 TRINITY_DN18523_c0_g2_i2:123-584(+)
MIRRPPRSTLSSSSAASDVYKRQVVDCVRALLHAVLVSASCSPRELCDQCNDVWNSRDKLALFADDLGAAVSASLSTGPGWDENMTEWYWMERALKETPLQNKRSLSVDPYEQQRLDALLPMISQLQVPIPSPERQQAAMCEAGCTGCACVCM